MPTKTPANTMLWQAECSYISHVTGLRGNVVEMNYDRAVFVRYCEMQRDAAKREGYDDSAQYIQHCIDDLTETGFYVTTYCNFAHRLSDGKPIAHECYILPPAALSAEREGDTDKAIAILQAAKPLRVHRGIKATKA